MHRETVYHKIKTIKTMKKQLLIALIGCSTVAFAQPASSPAGYYVGISDCMRGGTNYYFNADGTCLAVEEYGGPVSVSLCTWKLNGDIEIKYHTVYYPIGENVILPVGDIEEYESYKAAKKSVSTSESVIWNDELGNECSEAGKMKPEQKDLRYHLRVQTKVPSYRSEFSERLLTESELKNYSKDELRKMRNSIFATYGYKFKTSDMQAYFGTSGFMSDVTAYLSDIETKNIELMKKVENGK